MPRRPENAQNSFVRKGTRRSWHTSGFVRFASGTFKAQSSIWAQRTSVKNATNRTRPVRYNKRDRTTYTVRTQITSSHSTTHTHTHTHRHTHTHTHLCPASCPSIIMLTGQIKFFLSQSHPQYILCYRPKFLAIVRLFIVPEHFALFVPQY